MRTTLIIGVLTVMAAGCGDVSSQFDTASTPAHWKDGPYLLTDGKPWGTHDYLICDDSKKIIAEVFSAEGEPLGVYGGDGRGYGDYADIADAKKKAESLAGAFADTPLLRCP